LSKYFASAQNTIIALHQGIFQGIVIYLIYKENDG
jgi:hypothetical protein